MEVITPRRNYQMTADRLVALILRLLQQAKSLSSRDAFTLGGHACSEQELREWAWTIERSIGILREQILVSQRLTASLLIVVCLPMGRCLGCNQKRVYMLRAPNEGELLDWLRTLERAGCLVGTADASSATMFYDDVGDSDSDDDGSSTALGAALSAVRMLYQRPTQPDSALLGHDRRSFFGACKSRDGPELWLPIASRIYPRANVCFPSCLPKIADRASPDVKDNSPDRQSGLVKHRAQTAAVTYGNLAAPVSDLDFSTFDSFQDLHKYLQPQCLVVAGLKGAGPGPRTPTLARATVPDEATRMPPGDVTVSLEGGKRRSVTLRTTMDDNVPARAATLTPLNEAPHAFDAAANVASRDPARMGAAAARFARTNPQECQLSSSGRRLSRSAQDIRAPSAAASLASTADDAPPDRSRSFSLNNPFNVDELRKAGYRPDASLGHSPA
ncbi:uncharacterized protein MONBRDRAFT_9366 [Monosiga brevicollis MX1]|uniref:Uncharacterized protein n=1 Tax=Monosiga brevicollis TaxID=81824 RepID=A9V2X5_MONBE|nr:uncharacterized protein MONBRDRAFT_9366 [Monosiga brevicollis MX1]EDQ87960.1 predicted protein [Monosiga brevicollis MX1]|eukprot:XP_001747036.1 hypothetical protein [Monosiga brevicollis MX1]